jgi:hypothetical protein
LQPGFCGKQLSQPISSALQRLLFRDFCVLLGFSGICGGLNLAASNAAAFS